MSTSEAILKLKSTLSYTVIIGTACSIGFPAPAMASCGDRPGTPADVRADPIPVRRAGETPGIKLSWRDTTRRNETDSLGYRYYDIYVTNPDGSPAPGLGSTGEGNLYGFKIFKRLQPGRQFCFQMRARTEGGTQGCISQVPSNRACAVVPGASTPPLNYGPDTCVQGFVWREAGRNDHVCVLPGSRSLVARENQSAGSRRNPRGGPYGPDTCLQGFVWREAFAGDHVCVSTQRRVDVRNENRWGPGRRVR